MGIRGARDGNVGPRLTAATGTALLPVPGHGSTQQTPSRRNPPEMLLWGFHFSNRAELQRYLGTK